MLIPEISSSKTTGTLEATIIKAAHGVSQLALQAYFEIMKASDVGK
jgi:hypothetical protein